MASGGALGGAGGQSMTYRWREFSAGFLPNTHTHTPTGDTDRAESDPTRVTRRSQLVQATGDRAKDASARPDSSSRPGARRRVNRLTSLLPERRTTDGPRIIASLLWQVRTP